MELKVKSYEWCECAESGIITLILNLNCDYISYADYSYYGDCYVLYDCAGESITFEPKPRHDLRNTRCFNHVYKDQVTFVFIPLNLIERKYDDIEVYEIEGEM